MTVFACLVRGSLEAESVVQAQALLTSGERSQFAAISRPERRVEWLGGRVVAKHVVCRMLSQMLRRPPRLQDVEVNRPDGRAPMAILVGRPGQGLPISISHCGTAIAAAAAPDHAARVGIDVERVDPRLCEIAGRFCTSEEQAWVIAPDDRALAAAFLWCCKEAAIKWAGGASLRRASYAVLPSPDRLSADVRVAPGLDLAPMVAVRVWDRDGHVVALAQDLTGGQFLVEERLADIVAAAL